MMLNTGGNLGGSALLTGGQMRRRRYGLDFSKGLVAHWTFDNDTPPVFTDSVGGITATGTSGTATDEGIIGTALSTLPLNTTCLLSSYDNLMFGSGSFTVMAFIKRARTTNERIFSAGHFGWSTGFFLGLSTTQSRTLFGVGSSAGQSGATEIRGSVTTTEWHHIAGVFDADAMQQYIVLDGVRDTISLKTSGTYGTVVGDYLDVSGGNFNANPSVTPRIGGHSHTQWPYAGLTDDLRIYNRAVPPEEIAALISYLTGAA